MRGNVISEDEVSLIFRRGFLEHRESLLTTGELLEDWQDDSRPGRSTKCFETDRHLWIIRADLGGIRFSRYHREILACPMDGIDLRQFERVVKHDWLPFVYPFWQTQVLHASAAVHLDTGLVAAFSGPSGSGKSTLAYGLGSRQGWQQLADDSLAFRVDKQDIQLVPIPNEIRLRPKSADHFRTTPYSREQLQWSQNQLKWCSTCFLKPAANGREGSIRCVKETEAYPGLLKQAFTMTTKARELNQSIMRDYLTLSHVTRSFQLDYPMRFDAFAETIDLIESVCLGQPR